MEIWSSQIGVAQEAMHKVRAKPEDIAAIGITNQRETTVVWDRKTGKPVYPAIVWQCRRTSDVCERLIEEGMSDAVRERTGLPIDAYFSATKIAWIIDHVPDGRKKAESGDWLFGTVDSWLLWNLTGGRVHATDYTNASRTMLYNIHTLEWDPWLLDLFGVPACVLPAVQPSSGSFGETDAAVFGTAIPVGGIAGDQQAALFGQTCFEKGEVKNTYGTGCFLLMNTGRTPVMSHSGLLTTIAWGLSGEVNEADPGFSRIGAICRRGGRYERRVLCTRIRRTGCPALESACAGNDYGADARCGEKSHHPRCARSDRLSDDGCAVRYGARFGHAASGAAGRRRCER
jgi:glycerol kinase